jgi:hypothetical protein
MESVNINLKWSPISPWNFCIRACTRSHSPRSGFSRPQDSTRINHCYNSANSSCFVERGRCAQHAKIPLGSSLTSDTYE